MPTPPNRKGTKASRPQLTIAAVRKALEVSRGIYAHAAAALGVDRSIITQWCNRHPELREYALGFREYVVDDALNTVVTSITHADPNVALRASLKVLEYWGREVGFGNKRIEHSGPGGKPIEMQFDLSGLSDEELSQLEALQAKIERGES